MAEPGPAPILTPTGIVLVYNGADDKLAYRTGVAIFDRKDPRKLIWRSDHPIFEPEKQWEKVGQVPNVVFVEGMVKHDGRYCSIAALISMSEWPKRRSSINSAHS